MLTDKLLELTQKLSRQKTREVLEHVILFPKTESLANYKFPFANCEQSTLDINEAMNWVMDSPDLLATKTRDEVRLVLDIMRDLEKEWLLDKYESIVISRGGLNIFRLINASAKSNCSIFIEMNYYRQKLQEEVSEMNSNVITGIQIGLIVVSVGFLIYLANSSSVQT